MTARPALGALAALAGMTLAGAPAAHAAPATVDIPGRYFAPARVSVIVGDSVTWVNRDFFDHDVAALDRAFDSGPMRPGASFAQTFTRAGVVPYLCRIHPLMRGEVEVFSFELRGPPVSVAVGREAVLRGLAPAGTAAVTIERRQPDGSFMAVATATVAPNGAFQVRVVPAGPTIYRAVAGAATSAPFALPVSARVRVTVRRLRGGRVALRAAASPAQPGVPAALELYSRERFDWRQVDHARLNGRSTVTFRLRAPRRQLKARVLLLRGRGGYAPGMSATRTIRPPR
jgi:plastocyanin